MLVLSRKIGESIKIGERITVVVNRIAGNRVTLGLDVPLQLRIVRGELELFGSTDVEAVKADAPPVPHRAR